MKRPTFKPEVVELLTFKKHKELPKQLKKPFFNKIPEVKPLPFKAGAFIFGGLTIIGITISTTIGAYVFFGAITLAGLIAIAESNKYVRHFVAKSNRLLDIAIFGFTLFATVSLGIMMTASLTFAGLGYTLVYGPYLRSRSKK